MSDLMRNQQASKPRQTKPDPPKKKQSKKAKQFCVRRHHPSICSLSDNIWPFFPIDAGKVVRIEYVHGPLSEAWLFVFLMNTVDFIGEKGGSPPPRAAG